MDNCYYLKQIIHKKKFGPHKSRRNPSNSKIALEYIQIVYSVENSSQYITIYMMIKLSIHLPIDDVNVGHSIAAK